jgi:hypothetical protein
MPQVQQVKTAIGEDATLSRLLPAFYHSGQLFAIKYLLFSFA